MHILIVTHHQFDGSPYCSYIHAQAKAFAELGHTVRVFVFVPYLKPEAKALGRIRHVVQDGVAIAYIRHISLSTYGKYHVNIWGGYMALLRAYAALLNDFQPDVIHAHGIGFAGAIATRLKRVYDVPVIITTHGSDTTLEYERGNGVFLSNICAGADGIVSVSTKMEKILHALDGKRNVHVIPNGFDSSNAVRMPKRPHSIISVGNLLYQKRFHITIDAFAEIHRTFPAFTMTIVGIGPELTALKQQAENLGVQESIRFTGQLPNSEVLQLMAESEYFILPSVREGFGIVYLEAMASGCIVIGTQEEGIADILTSGYNGILVPPDNAAAIVDALSKCFYDRDYAQHLTVHALESIKSLTWKHNAERNIKLFEDIMNG